MKANIIVRLKPGVHDPQGETISNALRQLGYLQARGVRQGKFFELELDTDSREEALRVAHEVARRLLANPVLEVFEVEVEG